MFDFHEKRKMRRIAYSWPTLGILFLVVVFLGVQVWGVYTKNRQASERRHESVAALAELQQRELELKEEIEKLSTERGIEEEIRSKFEVARSGEQIIVVVDSPDEETEQQEEKKGFFSWLFSWL